MRRFDWMQQRQGAFVNTGPSDAHVLSASITVSVELEADGDEATDAALDFAEAKLDAAISPIERDPEVQWQISRLSIVRRG